MANKLLAIPTEFLRSFLSVWRHDIVWPRTVLDSLTIQNLDMPDVLHVMNTGDVIECEKETSDGAVMVVEGRTCDDTRVRVEFWADVNLPLIKIRRVVVI